MNDVELAQRKHRCYFDINGRIQVCPGMNTLLDMLEPKVVIENLFNFKTGKERDLGVAIQKTKKHKGLLFTVCPFCGNPAHDANNTLKTTEVPYYDS